VSEAIHHQSALSSPWRNNLTTSLSKKLLLKPGVRALILNAPPKYLKLLDDLPEDAVLDTRIDGQYAFVHLFVGNQAELAEFASLALGALQYDGLLWISYPKLSSKVATDLTRDHGWEPIIGRGLQGVTQIAIDETWSALRFRPSERIGK
jgi:hypothetical protein